MEKEIKKEYSNGEITVVWKPKLCIHSEICVKTLPEVYKPGEKPWIRVENAATDDLRSQVEKCPSGALSYYMNTPDPGKSRQYDKDAGIIIDMTPDGPLLVKGPITLNLPEGKSIESKDVTALCRCGASGNKPFCDGSHLSIQFKG